MFHCVSIGVNYLSSVSKREIPRTTCLRIDLTDGGTCRFQPNRSEVLEKLLLAKDLAEYTGGRIVLVFSGRGEGGWQTWHIRSD